MQPARVVSAVETDETVGARWWSGGPAVVYDGLGLESESEPIELWHTCLSCREKAVRFDVREVLAAGREIAGADGAPWVLQLAEAFGLETADPLDRRAISTSRGDTPHLLRSDCTRCGARHGAVLGYGEHQPARYVATLEGVALVESIPEDPTSGDAASTVGVVVAVLAVLAMAGLIVWFNWSAVSDWRLAALLERSGVVTEATVTAERESHGPRSPDQFWLTVRYVVGGTTYEDERLVDAATHYVATIDDRAEVVYLPTDPSRFDVHGNDQHVVGLVLVVIIDLLLVVAGVAVARQARREGQAEDV